MKTSNYLAKLPQEAAIKNIQAFRDYDLITLDVPVLPDNLVLLHLFLVFPSIPPALPRELLVFLVSLKSFCFFRCTPAFLEVLLISMVFLMRTPDFPPVPPDKHEAFLVLIPCVRCSHSCSILPVI